MKRKWHLMGNAVECEDTVQLTQAKCSQGGAAIYQHLFNYKLVEVEFEYKMHNPSNNRMEPGADGLCFFIADADLWDRKTMGDKGGHLFYRGLPFAYLGIGFDLYGNFSGGGPSGRNNVTVRGQAPHYKILTQQKCIHPLDGPSWKKVSILLDLGSTPGDPKTISVTLDPGTFTHHTHKVIENVNIGAKMYVGGVTPKTFICGFAAATGMYTNEHRIRRLRIKAKSIDMPVSYKSSYDDIDVITH